MAAAGDYGDICITYEDINQATYEARTKIGMLVYIGNFRVVSQVPFKTLDKAFHLFHLGIFKDSLTYLFSRFNL